MSQAGTKRLGLIGLGQFGRFAAEHLAPHFDIVAADRTAPTDLVVPGVRPGTLAQAAGCGLVVLAVPIQALPGVLDKIAPHVQDGALVMDVCSVKTRPMDWMRERLPAHAEIVGTHPMFGPQSAGAGLRGHTIVLCPERTSRLDAIRTFLESLGLRVLIADRDAHDFECACTQAVSQYVGRALRDFGGGELTMTTPAARLLYRAAALVAGDSSELFAAIQTYNPYAAAMRERLHERFRQLDERLAGAEAGEGPHPPTDPPAAASPLRGDRTEPD